MDHQTKKHPVWVLFCFKCEARIGDSNPERARSVKENSSVNCFSAKWCETGTDCKAMGRRAVDARKRIHPRWITKQKSTQGTPSIKQVLISLRDPNGVAVRPSGFDCVRPCHSERSGAESNFEAAPSKAKVESRADSAQDDTQGTTPSKKITKGVRAILFVLLFTRLALQGIVC